MASNVKPSGKWKALEFLVNRGFSLSRCTDSRTVQSFIDRFHPVTTSKPLIRLGADGDGGYLTPDDLDGIVACFSPGVDKVATFESAIVSRGIPCYLADASVAGPPISNPLIHFDKLFLGVVEDDTTITLDKWVRNYAPPQGDLLLQMDIEGAEYPVLLSTSEEVLKRFRVIVLELHDLERLVDPLGFKFISSALDRLLAHFHVVHLHPNNIAPPLQAAGLTIPRLLEITLVRKDRLPQTGYAQTFPHPLDSRNLTDRPDLPLPMQWYHRRQAAV
jgi:hypothetical protein